MADTTVAAPDTTCSACGHSTPSEDLYIVGPAGEEIEVCETCLHNENPMA